MEELIARIEAGERSNALDVLIEIALFAPTDGLESVRPNAAGTKVIYTDKNGEEFVHWAPEWSAYKEETTKSLRLGPAA